MTILFHPPGSDLLICDAEVLVNPVNCVGTMGRGLALAFKERFPENCRIYQRACKRGELRPGHLIAIETGLSRPTHIVNLATKDHWKDRSKIEWVSDGASRLKDWAQANGVQSVACPALGAGLGGVSWQLVRAALLDVFTNSTVEFNVFEPHEPELKPLRATAVAVGDEQAAAHARVAEPKETPATPHSADPATSTSRPADQRAPRIQFRRRP